jgi:hypothetical protein
MDITIEYTESAFKHGVSKESIINAVKTKVYDAPLVAFTNKNSCDESEKKLSSQIRF